MALATGPTLTGATVGQVLAEIVTPRPRHLRVIILISATYGFDALLEVWDGRGQVAQDLVLKVGQSLWTSPELGPFILEENGRLRVVMRSTPQVMPGPFEVQASIFYRDWAER